MPNYLPETLQRLQHKPKIYPQYSPHHYAPFIYGRKGSRQYVNPTDTSTPLTPKATQWVQSAIGSLLYYARALDATMLPTLNQLGAEQAHPTENTKVKLQQLMDYANTYPNAVLRFHASDMVLHIDSDAAYLVLPKARSRVAGYFRLLNQTPKSPDNGAILVECKGLQHVVSSAAEAETHGVFHNAKIRVNI